MAYKNDAMTNNNKLRVRKFSKTSKMKKYKIIYDEESKQNVTGFMNYIQYSPKLHTEDKIWEVEPGFEYRMDLISTKFYNTSQFDWMLEQINNIRDPIKDVVIGKKLIIPSKSKLFSLT